MRVLLVTSEGACGIAEHSAYLKQAVEAADPSVRVELYTNLHPALNLDHPFDLLWLNYHAALHSQWTPEWIERYRAQGVKVGVTYHDTGVPNSDHCKSIHAVADAFVVHEPCEDLPGAIYWRQGVPGPQPPFACPWENRPCLGTVGFPFPWKNYDLLCEATAAAGWGILLYAPTATDVDQVRWEQLNPRATIVPVFHSANIIVSGLGACDATAFMYNCHNTGTSGAIRQGIAARKPVIASTFNSAFTGGRQFRDLHMDPLARRVITWIEPTRDELVFALSRVRIAPLDAGIVALAEQDSWAKLGHKYAQLFRSLIA